MPPETNHTLPLYNSRIVKVFFEYLESARLDVDTDCVLDYAGMTRFEMEDPAHWFSQDQVDRFYEILVQETGRSDLSRNAGRYTVSSKALGAAKQYTLGLLSPMSVFLLMGKLYPIMSRGATITARKLGPGAVEILATPKPGVHEKPYQCENRLGTLEALPKWFTGKMGRIEHTSCVHRGDDSCRYVIHWDQNPSLFWRRIRLLWAVACMPIVAALLLAFPVPVGGCAFFAALAGFALMTSRSEQLEKRELMQTVELQGDAAKDLMAEINARYNTSLLVKEIGQAASSILGIEELSRTVARIMQQRLEFDRAMIMLADKEGRRLEHVAGYGYTEEEGKILRRTSFHLDNPESKGPVVRAFREQKPFLLNDIRKEKAELSERTRRFIQEMGVVSLICVPIVFKTQSLGVLAVDNIQSRRPLTQSDLGLLLGVASQTAVGVFTALSYQRLQESEKSYRELVESANSIILRVDTEGRIRFVNEFAQRRLEVREGDVLGKPFHEVLPPSREDAAWEFETLVKTLRREPDRSAVREMENTLATGEKICIAWTYRPIVTGDGEVGEILFIGNDITELKAAEKEKKQLALQLMKAQKMEAIGTLAGGIAHDFNNILQAVRGYTQILLLNKPVEDPDREKLEAIDGAARRASELIKQLLIFGRKVESRLRPVDLNQEVVQVIRMLRRTIPKMIEIQHVPEERLQLINGDTVQLEQIMMNLGINGRDAMQNGGVLRFETSNVFLDNAFCRGFTALKPGAYVLLSVSDSGCGMERGTLDRIFEPFFSTKETGRGTGLGLAMVYGIVKNHNGIIICESEVARGTTFHIYFPVLQEGRIHAQEEKEAALAEGSGETLMLVDDDSAVREMGREILTRFGYRVLTAQSGEEALSLYDGDREGVRLIILDWIMPGMGGIGCLKALMERNALEKIVIASGYAPDEPFRNGIDPERFLQKPWNIPQLVRLVHDVLQES